MKFKKTAIAIVVGIIIGFCFRETKNGTTSKGNVEKKYEKLRKIFDQILKYEKEGLAVAVYKDNHPIADLWGGYAERDAMRLWEKDTVTIGFSTTKAMGALIIAILVSQKRMKYEDKVTKYWPEFRKHGKDNITIQGLVEHKAGLIKFDGELDLKHATDHQYISKLIEETKPMWPPGTAVGYHALTYGWLLDQIVRRVDAKKRGLAEFYDQEIRSLAKDKDYYIGLPRSEHYRVARIVSPTCREFVKSFVKNPFFMRFVWHNLMDKFDVSNYLGFMGIAGSYPPWLDVLKWEMPYNNPKVQEVPNAAVTGFGTARGFASAVAGIMQSSLISQEIWERISKPTGLVMDRVVKLQTYRGHGFFYETHPTKKDAYLMMHTGHGRQKIMIDPSNKIVVVLLRNGLSWDIGADSWTNLIVKNVLVADEKQ